MNNPQHQHGGGHAPQKQSPPRASGDRQQQQHQQHQHQHQQQQPPSPDENKITPELLVDALSGHEDGLLSIAERLMTHYDSGYDAMGEAIIDAFADVQKLFQHVVEAAHMEGAALERERGEGEWKRRMEHLGMDVEGVLYGRMDDDDDALDRTGATGSPSRGDRSSGELGGDDGDPRNDSNGGGQRNNNNHNPSPTKLSEEHHRHEELIDQDVRDVLIDAIKKGQSHRDAHRYAECQSLYETACGSASALLPVDSDHRGRLQLAVARAESMGADRACTILKYAMDDVLRSGLSLRRGVYPQVDVKERSDCVLERPNPLRSVPSRGYDGGGGGGASWDRGGNYSATSGGGGGGGGGGRHHNDVSTSTVEQSAEEALNSLVEEMKEILGAPVYNLTPLQNVSENFWLALGEAKRSSAKKEDRLEQALAKIKADFLLAREEYEEQLAEERERTASLRRRCNDLRRSGGDGWDGENRHRRRSSPRSGEDGADLHSPSSRSSDGNEDDGHHDGGNVHYQFGGMDDGTATNSLLQGRNNDARGARNSSNHSVVSLGSEFAQKAKSLVHLLNCQGKEPIPGGNGRGEHQPATAATRGFNNDDLAYGRGMRGGGSPR